MKSFPIYIHLISLSCPSFPDSTSSISSLRTAMGVFPLLVCLSHVYISFIRYICSCGCSGRWFLLNCIILINRNNTRILYIIQTDIRNTTILSHKDSLLHRQLIWDFRKNSKQADCPKKQIPGCPLRQIHKVIFPGVLIIQGQSLKKP